MIDRSMAQEKAKEALELAAASEEQPRVAQAAASIATHWLALAASLPAPVEPSGSYL